MFNTKLIIKNMSNYIDEMGYKYTALEALTCQGRNFVKRHLTFGNVTKPLEGLMIIADSIGKDLDFFDNKEFDNIFVSDTQIMSSTIGVNVSLSAKEINTDVRNIVENAYKLAMLLDNLEQTKKIRGRI